jgi:hypothetical protein
VITPELVSLRITGRAWGAMVSSEGAADTLLDLLGAAGAALGGAGLAGDDSREGLGSRDGLKMGAAGDSVGVGRAAGAAAGPTGESLAGSDSHSRTGDGLMVGAAGERVVSGQAGIAAGGAAAG